MTQRMDQARKLMQAGVSESVFPGGVLLVSEGERIMFLEAFGKADIFEDREMTVKTVFDLASLTKPLATAMAVMALVQEGRVALDRTLRSIIPEFNSPETDTITLRHLLTHTSGLPDYVPYYKEMGDGPFDRRKKRLRSLLVKTPLVFPPGQNTLYSDVGFMTLAWVVERLAGMGLDTYARRKVYNPLGLGHEKGLFFVDLNTGPAGGAFAATEDCPWRNRVLRGEVHDENAWAAGGVQGHAGLFGNAESVHVLLSSLLSPYHATQEPEVFSRNLVRAFLTPEEGLQRSLGFDTPDRVNSSAGKYFSENSVGHLGFTGTSFWMDLNRCVIVILLTNRVHPSRENDRIKFFRPRLHDAVMKEVAGSDRTI
jgi:serine-type D-Ala-D-Ala carboxypeptidase